MIQSVLPNGGDICHISRSSHLPPEMEGRRAAKSTFNIQFMARGRIRKYEPQDGRAVYRFFGIV